MPKYYLASTTRIALRKYVIPQSMEVEYLLGDHLGSTALTTDAAGKKVSEMRYTPWGEVRYAWKDPGLNTTPAYALTKWTFTGQYRDSYINLLWYGSRHYDSELGRFISPDTIVPLATQGVQAWDRYAFVNNAPTRYIDPDGHGPVGDYFTGLILELGRTLAWFSPQAQKDLAIQPSESDAMLAGGLTTDVAAMVAGAGAITEGASGAGVGVAACATGAGCIVSGVVVASGGALILMGAGGGLRAAEGAATALAQFASRGSNGSSMTDSQIRDSIRSFQDLIPEHEAKPQAYIEDPDAYDNLGLLKGASKELREQIIQGRIEKLQAEIEKFKGELQKMYDILREN